MYAFQHLAPKTSDEQYSYTISNIMYAATVLYVAVTGLPPRNSQSHLHRAYAQDAAASITGGS